MDDPIVGVVDRYLKSLGSSLFGQSFEIADPARRLLAAQWVADVGREISAFRAKEQSEGERQE